MIALCVRMHFQTHITVGCQHHRLLTLDAGIGCDIFFPLLNGIPLTSYRPTNRWNGAELPSLLVLLEMMTRMTRIISPYITTS
jgi:hypothetical protein